MVVFRVTAVDIVRVAITATIVVTVTVIVVEMFVTVFDIVS